MNKPSSTILASGSWGFLAALGIGLIAIFWPDAAARIPPGFEAALAVGIGTVLGYLKKENVISKK